MVKRKKKKKSKRGFVFPKGVDPMKFGRGLKARQKQTLMKVLDSQASPSTKARARLMLEKLK